MIRFGIIGMGVRGKMFAETIGQNPFAEVGAVCDSNASAAAETGRTFGVTGYTDYKEMIDNEDLNAVIIATPDHLHRDPVVYAAENGLDMLVEKPFATTEEDSKAMVEAIEKGDVKCMVAFENRWNMPIAATKMQIASGAVGDVLNVNARLNNLILSPTQNLSWSKNSSVGWFLFPHILDMTMWFNGGKKVDRIFAVGTKKKLKSMGYDIYDTLQATITFVDETHATLTSTWILPATLALGYDLKIEIVGSEHAMYINTHDQCVTYLGDDKIHNIHSLSTPINGKLTGCPSLMLHNFVDCLKDNVEIESDYKVGAYNTKIICAIHRSADNGGEIIKID